MLSMPPITLPRRSREPMVLLALKSARAEAPRPEGRTGHWLLEKLVQYQVNRGSTSALARRFAPEVALPMVAVGPGAGNQPGRLSVVGLHWMAPVVAMPWDERASFEVETSMKCPAPSYTVMYMPEA